MQVIAKLNKPQGRFMQMPHKFRAYVAGFGSGKTWVGGASMCAHYYQWPGVNQGYFAPTYAQIRDIFYPTIEEVAYSMGMSVEIKLADKEINFYTGKTYRGTTICRSMDRPDTIIGFKIGNALVDELDVLTVDKATSAWRKIIARMRYNVSGLKNGVDVTTTPEGFKFVYKQFKKAVERDNGLASLYGLVQASTYDNAKNLNDDYISSIEASYPPELIAAYLNGQFTNLTSGTIYTTYDSELNNCDHELTKHDPLFIGMDFNVDNMSAVVHIYRDGNPCAVDEIIGAKDTPDIIRIIKERYFRYVDGRYRRERSIIVYPDSTGDNRKSVNASITDISLLESAGLSIEAQPANPPVKDRVNSMKAMFCDGAGRRRYLVNKAKCPTYSEDLQQQIWNDNGEPDKKGGNDHRPDAAGYFIYERHPLNRNLFHVGSMT